MVPGFICLTVKWKEIDLSANKDHRVGCVLGWRSVDSLQSMVEGTEERLHRKAVLEQSPGDNVCPDPHSGGGSIPGRGSSVSKDTEVKVAWGRRICVWPAGPNHRVPGLSKMRLDSRGRSVCSHCKSCDQRRVLIILHLK